MKGLINVAAEITRLNREIAKLESELSRISGKLKNQNFVAKAPTAVVDKEKGKLTEAQAVHQKLTLQLAQLKELDE